MHYTFFSPRLPRHPLLRALAGIATALVVVGLVVFGVFAAVALISVGAIVWLLRSLRGPAAPPAAAPRVRAPAGGTIYRENVVVRESRVRRIG
jgi:hypothetical protein